MYDYKREKPYVFTDEGQRKTLAILRLAQEAMRIAGCIRAGKLLAAAGGGNSWELMACVDRLVELEELREIPTEAPAWQLRVYETTRE